MTVAALRPRFSEAPGDAFVQWSNDDLSRAALIFARARAEARRADARCAQWWGSSRSVWREVQAGEALRQRRNARIALRLTYRWLATAFLEWRPADMRGH